MAGRQAHLARPLCLAVDELQNLQPLTLIGDDSPQPGFHELVPNGGIVAIDEALEEFAAIDKPKAELVKLRYFVGLTLDQAAEVLGVSTPTAKRWWTYARAWVRCDILGEK